MPNDPAAIPAPPPNAGQALLSVRGLRRNFGAVAALAGVDLDFYPGEIHAILGENGAGKSTLMNAIYGLVRLDGGAILVDGRPVHFGGPLDARQAGIGMVHQEFALFEVLTVSENLALALSPAREWRLRLDRVAAAAGALAAEIGLDLGDLDARVETLPVGTRQRLEILKALSGQTRILILDEPTAVLTPVETAQLFRMLVRLRARGGTVLFITHKLREALEVADRVTVMRHGRVVRTVRAAEASERALAEAMVGTEPVPAAAPRPRQPRGAPLLRIEELSVVDERAIRAVDALSLEVRSGEIVGIAGVDGNGQWELFQVLAGLRRPTAGSIHLAGTLLTRFSPEDMIQAGASTIPPDRQRQGLVLEMTVAENLILNCALLARLASGPFLPRAASRSFAGALVQRYVIRTDGLDVPAATLSGGNQQRLVVARALSTDPQLLVAFNPTRGLDFAATGAVHRACSQACERGAALLLISTDLDEILGLSDRVAVLYRGKLSPSLESPLPAERLGALMAGVHEDAGG